jgi:hypothetical protein
MDENEKKKVVYSIYYSPCVPLFCAQNIELGKSARSLRLRSDGGVCVGQMVPVRQRLEARPTPSSSSADF